MNNINPLFADVLASFQECAKSNDSQAWIASALGEAMRVYSKKSSDRTTKASCNVYIEPFEVQLTKPGFDPRDPEGWLEVIPTEEQMDKAVNWLCDKYGAELYQAVAELCEGKELK